MKTSARKTTKATRTSAPRSSKAPAAPIIPSHDDIAKRAYELFLARGGAHGSDAEDWIRAESELMSR